MLSFMTILPKTKGKKVLLATVSAVLAIALAVTLVVLLGGRREPDKTTLEKFIEQYGLVTPAECDGYYRYDSASDGEVSRGFIFYPDSRTSHEVYSPLMTLMVKKGIDCFIVDGKDADGVIAAHPEIEEWYVGGHGKGGMNAAEDVAASTSEIAGIVFLASYSKTDLTSLDLRAYSLYGSEDGIMDVDEYHASKENLPEASEEYKIVGCNYSGFAIYERLSGDGEPTMDNIEQIVITARRVSAFMDNSEK